MPLSEKEKDRLRITRPESDSAGVAIGIGAMLESVAGGDSRAESERGLTPDQREQRADGRREAFRR